MTQDVDIRIARLVLDAPLPGGTTPADVAEAIRAELAALAHPLPAGCADRARRPVARAIAERIHARIGPPGAARSPT